MSDYNEYKVDEMVLALQVQQQDEYNGHDVQQLIEPDGANDFVTRFEGIDNEVRAKQDGCCQHRRMREEDEDGGIGCAVVKQDIPAFALFDAHPGALKGKIPHEMAGQPDQQCGQVDGK